MNSYAKLFLAVLALLYAQIAYAEVELPLGNYHQTTDDITVKVKGGFVKASRTYYKDTWLYNRAWNNLEIEIDSIDGSVKSITRNNNGYDRPSSSSSLYEYDKTKWIRKTASGFRWEDRKGNWIEYNAKGVIQKYGDRNNVEVSFKYNGNGQRTGVFDHFGTQVLWYTYYINGKIETIRDDTPTTPRTVKYIYTGDNLTQVIDVRGNTWKYEYSGKRLTKAIDPDGRPTNIAYHANGATKSVTLADGTGMFYGYNYDKSKREYYLSITESSGRVSELWYNRDGDLLRKDLNGITTISVVYDTKKDTKTNELGQVTVREYDDFDNLIKITYPDGSSVSSTYDSKYSNKLTVTDERGITSKLGYDSNGNLKTIIQAFGTPVQRVMEFTINVYGEAEQIKLVADSVTQDALFLASYDNNGNFVSTTDPEGNVTNYTSYNVMGNKIEWRDARNKLWKAEYDANGNITKVINPLTFELRAEYNGSDNLVKYFDELNKIFEYQYDTSNHLISIIDPLFSSRTTSYNIRGQSEKIKDEENKYLSLTFNGLDKIEKQVDGNNNSISYAYGDAAFSATSEKISKVIFPSYNRTYRYDSRERVVQVINNFDAKQQIVNIMYDAAGNVIQRTSPDGLITKYQYDNLNRVIAITNPVLKTTNIVYDNRDNLLSVINENSIGIRSYTYDRNNRTKTITWPNGAVFSYTYNANGQIETVIDNKNQLAVFIYDDAGRQIRKEFYQSPAKVALAKAVDYTYNNADSLTGYNDGTTSAIYTYDDAQRRTSETINYPGFSKTQAYTYYKNSKLKSYKGADNIEYTYSYDANNQFSGMTVPGEGAITINQNKWFAAEKITLPGGSTKTNSFDGLMRVKSMLSQDSASNPIQTLGYSYYENDSIKTRTTKIGSYSYLYDNLDRLTDVTNPDTSQENYTYDAVGNRITSSDTIGDWQYNTTNQLTDDTKATYIYNANGNLQTKTTDTVVERFIYNIESRLSEVQNTSGTTVARYYYDPFGRRLWKEVGGIRTYYMPREEGIAAEFDSAGAVIQTYGYEPDTTFGTKPLITRTNAGTYYYHLDNLGTPQKLTDKTGSIVWEASYSAFGKAAITTEIIKNNLRMAGQYFDAETGFYHNYFRDYDPSTGRYIQSDPIGLGGGLHTYAYGFSNPLFWLDPYGLACHDFDLWGLAFDVALAFAPIPGTRVALAARLALRAAKLAKNAKNAKNTTILGENMLQRVIPYAKKTGARTLPFGTKKEKWAKLTPKQRWKLNDGALRKRINEGDNFKYIGRDPARNPAARKKFDLTGSELLRLKERGIPYETVTP